MALYDDRRMRDLPDDVLRTRISHLAHDLDKTINTELGTVHFQRIGDREARALESALSKWHDRGLPEANPVIVWARGVLQEFHTLSADSSEQFRESVSLDLESGEALLELIRSRRSVRSWTTQQVPLEVVRMLLEAATWAPSACNRQSCRYIVLTKQEQKMRLVRLREKFLGKAPILILVGADQRNYSPEEIDIVPYLDVAVAVQNLLLEAHAIGLGAVLVKCTARDIHMDSDYSGGQKRAADVSAMYSGLNLPSYFIPVAIVALGFPARVPKPPGRLPVDQVTVFERFADGEEERRSSRQKVKGMHSKAKFTLIRIMRRVARRFGIRIYMTVGEDER